VPQSRHPTGHDRATESRRLCGASGSKAGTRSWSCAGLGLSQDRSASAP
jgi:hypothetical protein